MTGLKIKNFILDTLFPISCLSCGAPDVWLCPECFSKIKILPDQVCPYCEKVFAETGAVCPACKISYLKKNDQPPLDSLVVAAKYADGNLARLVHAFKYNFVQDLSLPLGNLLVRAATVNDLPLPDLIVPVPLHPRRLRWRGFNQAERLADYLAQNLAPGMIIPIGKNIIRRRIYTPPQMKIKNYRERQKNLAGAFVINPPSPVLGRGAGSEGEGLQGKTILLVDDICTTGSTLLECARALKLGGAKKVHALVLARQEMGKKK
ncbi:MAG: ComF family protein [Candidatus Pacebacteria bacterium]|nr:ComF family protein [Candidatus Paceibacterota bacterium]